MSRADCPGGVKNLFSRKPSATTPKMNAPMKTEIAFCEVLSLMISENARGVAFWLADDRAVTTEPTAKVAMTSMLPVRMRRTEAAASSSTRGRRSSSSDSPIHCVA